MTNEELRKAAMSMQGEKRTIKVAIGNYEDPVFFEVEAEVFGDLGMRESLEARQKWTVTHVPTGYAIGPRFPEREQALEVVYLLKNHDWAFGHDKVTEYTSRMKELMQNAQAAVDRVLGEGWYV